MDPSSTPVVAFFGATGGCTLAALTRTLNAGINCRALVRTPSKLHSLLTSHQISPSTISTYLTIIQGNVKDVSAVSQTLTNPNGDLVDIILSGLGGTLKPRLSNILSPFTLDDPHICADGTRTILTAVTNFRNDGKGGAKKPIFTVISTTGIAAKRDVPIAFLPLYHWMLAVPHADKTVMEQMLAETMASGDPPIRGTVVVRPSLLVDGPAAKEGKLRVGWGGTDGGEGASGRVIGYTMTRESVGKWIFEHVVRGDGREDWVGRMVTLTE